jgi:hypothetical protein
MSASLEVRPQTGQTPIAAWGVRLGVGSLAIMVSDIFRIAVYRFSWNLASTFSRGPSASLLVRFTNLSDRRIELEPR